MLLYNLKVKKKGIDMSNYEAYGKLMVQKEILDGQIMQVKQKIQEEINKPVEPKEEVKEDVK
jgi:hypothetical protein